MGRKARLKRERQQRQQQDGGNGNRHLTTCLTGNTRWTKPKPEPLTPPRSSGRSAP